MRRTPKTTHSQKYDHRAFQRGGEGPNNSDYTPKASAVASGEVQWMRSEHFLGDIYAGRTSVSSDLADFVDPAAGGNSGGAGLFCGQRAGADLLSRGGDRAGGGAEQSDLAEGWQR